MIKRRWKMAVHGQNDRDTVIIARRLNFNNNLSAPENVLNKIFNACLSVIAWIL